MKRLIMTLAMSLALVLGLTACSGGTDAAEGASPDETGVIRIAIDSSMADSTAPLVDLVAEKTDYTLEVITYDDWTAPNTALMEGAADVNYFQHIPFMELYNEENDADLVMLEPRMFTGSYCLYSEKYDSIDEVEDGAHVAVISDPTNRDTSFRLLEQAGLIELADEPVADYYDVADVVSNPKNLQFDMMEFYAVLTVTGDEDLFVTTTTQYYEAGGDPTSYLAEIYFDHDLVGFSVREANADSDWAKALIEVAASDEYKAAIEELWPNCENFGF